MHEKISALKWADSGELLPCSSHWCWFVCWVGRERGVGMSSPRFHCRRHIPGSALIRHRAVEDKESVSGGVHSRPMINPAPIISRLQTLTDAEERRGPALAYRRMHDWTQQNVGKRFTWQKHQTHHAYTCKSSKLPIGWCLYEQQCTIFANWTWFLTL